MSRNSKVLLGVLGGALVVVLLTVFAGSVLFGSGPMMSGWGHMMGGWDILGVLGMGLMMLGMVLVPLLLLGSVVAAIVLAVTQLGSRGHAASEKHDTGSGGVHEQSAEAVLQQRFARGEINQEEYEERHRILLREASHAAHR